MGNIQLGPAQRVSTFRKLAVASWGAPSDPSVYGDVDIEMTAANAYLDKLRETTSEKVSITHLVGRVIAQVIAEMPQVNVVIRRWKFYPRKDVDAFFQIAMSDGSDLSGTVIRQANTKSVAEIARELREKAERVRTDQDKELAKSRGTLRRLPAWVLRPAFWTLDKLQYMLNLRVPGLPRDPFGSFMITSVGMFGISRAFAPLFPPSRCPIILLIGAVEKKPWVVDDDRIEARPVMNISMTFDHRVMDGFAAGKFSARVRELMANPSLLDP